MDEEYIEEEDVYESKEREKLNEDGELSPEEEGFMAGYEAADDIDKKVDVLDDEEE